MSQLKPTKEELRLLDSRFFILRSISQTICSLTELNTKLADFNLFSLSQVVCLSKSYPYHNLNS